MVNPDAVKNDPMKVFAFEAKFFNKNGKKKLDLIETKRYVYKDWMSLATPVREKAYKLAMKDRKKMKVDYVEFVELNGLTNTRV